MFRLGKFHHYFYENKNVNKKLTLDSGLNDDKRPSSDSCVILATSPPFFCLMPIGDFPGAFLMSDFLTLGG